MIYSSLYYLCCRFVLLLWYFPKTLVAKASNSFLDTNRLRECWIWVSLPIWVHKSTRKESYCHFCTQRHPFFECIGRNTKQREVMQQCWACSCRTEFCAMSWALYLKMDTKKLERLKKKYGKQWFKVWKTCLYDDKLIGESEELMVVSQHVQGKDFQWYCDS